MWLYAEGERVCGERVEWVKLVLLTEKIEKSWDDGCQR